MKRFLTFSNLRLAIEVVLVIAVLAAALSHWVATEAASTQAPEAPDAIYWYVCNGPNHIGLFTERVHIFCSSTTGVAGAPALDAAIHWFTVPTAPDSAAASRYMSLFQTSVIIAAPIWILVDPADTSGSSFGCAAADCRRIYAAEMR